MGWSSASAAAVDPAHYLSPVARAVVDAARRAKSAADEAADDKADIARRAGFAAGIAQALAAVNGVAWGYDVRAHGVRDAVIVRVAAAHAAGVAAGVEFSLTAVNTATRDTAVDPAAVRVHDRHNYLRGEVYPRAEADAIEHAVEVLGSGAVLEDGDAFQPVRDASDARVAAAITAAAAALRVGPAAVSPAIANAAQNVVGGVIRSLRIDQYSPFVAVVLAAGRLATNIASTAIDTTIQIAAAAVEPNAALPNQGDPTEPVVDAANRRVADALAASLAAAATAAEAAGVGPAAGSPPLTCVADVVTAAAVAARADAAAAALAASDAAASDAAATALAASLAAAVAAAEAAGVGPAAGAPPLTCVADVVTAAAVAAAAALANSISDSLHAAYVLGIALPAAAPFTSAPQVVTAAVRAALRAAVNASAVVVAPGAAALIPGSVFAPS